MMKAVRSGVQLISLTSQIAANYLAGYLVLKLMAVEFGTTAAKDSFDIAYNVPILIAYLSGFNLVHGIVVTQFSKLIAEGRNSLNSSFITCLNAMAMLAAVLVLAGIIWADALVYLLGPGLAPSVKKQCATLIRLMLPLVFTFGMSTYLSAALISFRVPIAAELCQLISRMGFLFWACATGFDFSLNQVAFWLVGFSLIGLIVMWVVLRSATPLRYELIIDWRDPTFATIGRQGIGLFLAILLSQLAMVIMRRMATLDGVGTTAALTYALSLTAPLALVVGKPLSMVIGIRYVTLTTLGHSSDAKKTLNMALIGCLVITGVASVILTRFSHDILWLLFGGGRFDVNSAILTDSLFRITIWSVPPHILLMVVLLPMLNLQGQQTTAIILGFGYLVQIIALYGLYPWLGREGLALAYVLSVCCQAAFGTYAVYKSLSHSSLVEQRKEV